MDRDDDKSSVENLIDANLRRVYDTVLNEDLPDRFSDLLAKLQASEGGPGSNSTHGDGEDPAAPPKG